MEELLGFLLQGGLANYADSVLAPIGPLCSKGGSFGPAEPMLNAQSATGFLAEVVLVSCLVDFCWLSMNLFWSFLVDSGKVNSRILGAFADESCKSMELNVCSVFFCVAECLNQKDNSVPKCGILSSDERSNR